MGVKDVIGFGRPLIFSKQNKTKKKWSLQRERQRGENGSTNFTRVYTHAWTVFNLPNLLWPHSSDFLLPTFEISLTVLPFPQTQTAGPFQSISPYTLYSPPPPSILVPKWIIFMQIVSFLIATKSMACQSHMLFSSSDLFIADGTWLPTPTLNLNDQLWQELFTSFGPRNQDHQCPAETLLFFSIITTPFPPSSPPSNPLREPHTFTKCYPLTRHYAR